MSLTDAVFKWLEHPGHSAVTSTVTMLELLVKPYQESRKEYVNQIYGLFSTFPNLSWVAPDLATADTAARIRAAHRLATPDALQAACTVENKATALITNDPVFERLEFFETVTLDRFLPDRSPAKGT